MSNEHHSDLSKIKTVADMVDEFRNEERCRHLLEQMVWPRGRIVRPAVSMNPSLWLDAMSAQKLALDYTNVRMAGAAINLQ